ncbi:hypothetical protein M5K25_015640 [Dendrobium thyrsiflorum]|uniref:Uncharacterized protein n=1 Tax=Dendrobium thyrsiflorum TaxID=117978 RepID=A0ABD0UYR8_DENTH
MVELGKTTDELETTVLDGERDYELRMTNLDGEALDNDGPRDDGRNDEGRARERSSRLSSMSPLDMKTS